MESRNITSDNLEDYEKILDADVTENIGRDNFRGLALHKGKDDPACAALIWELKNLDEDKDNEAELVYYFAGDKKNGEQLLEEAEAEFQEDEVKRSFFEFPEDTENAESIFKQAGFHPEKREGRDITVTVGELAALDIAKGNVPDFVSPIGNLMVRQFRKGIANCMFHGKKGLLEDLASLPMSWYDPEVSCCVEADGKVNGFLLIHKMNSGKLIVELMCAIGPDYRMDILHMLRFSIKAAAEKYPEETQVILRRHNDAVKNLSARLFPGKQGETVLAGEREEGR
ncbi:MAG: hypothetical protein IK115_09750 [Lachnospiraceae bacterium]|nr:hypothetical protein [Lachnospiraceae bacterium]